MNKETEKTGKIIQAAIEVHKHLGPGLLESAYEFCLAKEFDMRSIPYERQKFLPIVYKEMKFDIGYRIDFLVENEVIIEMKAIESVPPIAKAQLLTYMRLLKCKTGLILNFHVPVLKDGIQRLSL